MKESLQDMGLSTAGKSKGAGVGANTPQLVNVSHGPSLQGCLIYFLGRRDDPIKVGSDRASDISINGLGVGTVSATIENRDDEDISVTVCDAGEGSKNRVLVNGRKPEGQKQLKNGDRLILCFSFCFRVVIPSDARSRKSNAEPISLENALQEIVAEDSEAYQAFQLFSEVDGHIALLGPFRVQGRARAEQVSADFIHHANPPVFAATTAGLDVLPSDQRVFKKMTGEMSMDEFLAAAALTRGRLPPRVPRQAVPRMLCDGLGWEAPTAGVDIVAGSFVRVTAGRPSLSAEWEFIGKAVSRHDGGRWQVDLGCDYDEYFVIDSALLFGILHDLNQPGVVESYLRQRTLQGFRTSRRRGPDGRPIAT